MNSVLKEKIEITDKLIEKVKNTLNLSLDFDSIGVVQTSVYQNNLAELEKEIVGIQKDDYFKDALSDNGNETKEYSSDSHLLAKNYCLLTIKLLDQIKKEKENANEFISEKNKELGEKQVEITDNNKRIDGIKEKIKAKEIEIKNEEQELSKNLSDASLVEEGNEKLKNLYRSLSTYQNSLDKLEDENKKIENKKGKIINGTHSVSSKFEKRPEVDFREVEVPSDSELYNLIEESKSKYEEVMNVVNGNVDIDKLGVAGVAAYRENIIRLQKEINESFIKNSYNRIVASNEQLTNEQLASGMYKLSIVNDLITSQGLDKLEVKKEECTQIYDNGMNEYYSFRDRIENNKKQIENYKKANSDIHFRIVDLEDDPLKASEIDDLNEIINKNNILIDKLIRENESLTREVHQILNGGRIRKKAEVKKVEPKKEESKKEEPKKEEPKKAEPEKNVVPPVKMDKITVKKNNPKLTWKTALSVAAGIGIGTAVFFAAGPLGVGIMDAAGTIGKIAIKNKQKKLMNMTEAERHRITNVRTPRNGFEKVINNFKNYLNSEEGLRDMQWLISSAMITGSALSIGSAIQSKIAASKMPTAPSEGGIIDTPVVEQTPNVNTVATNVQPTNIVQSQPVSVTQTPYDNIILGNNVGGYNVSVGHTNAANAVNGFQSKTLISKYVNSESIFNRFAVINNDGSLGQIINTNGLSLTDFCTQNGIDISQIAVDVARKDGASQAWISISELTKDIGGMSL